MAKKCKGCEYFKVCYKPLKVGREIYDSGRVECTKHNLYADYTSTQKINRLECVEENDDIERVKG